jgi:hypothetical protein
MADLKVILMYVGLYLINFILVTLIIFLLYPPTRRMLIRWFRSTPEQKLKNYVQDTMDKGYSLKQIRKALLNAGYESEYVDRIMSEFSK